MCPLGPSSLIQHNLSRRPQDDAYYDSVLQGCSKIALLKGISVASLAVVFSPPDGGIQWAVAGETTALRSIPSINAHFFSAKK